MKNLITSRDNPTLKNAARLLNRKARDQQGKFLIEGVKMVKEALLKPELVEQVFVSDRKLLDRLDGLKGFKGNIIEIDARLVSVLSDTETPQGIWAVCKKPAWQRQIKGLKPRQVLLLAGIQDPGNLGTILRTAVAFGIDAVYLSRGTVDPYSPKALRAAMGATFHIPLVCDVEYEDVITLKSEGYGLIACTPRGDVELPRAEFPDRMMLMIGSEGKGLPHEIEEMADIRVKIPLQPAVESLNAAVACAVFLYEISLRRGMRL